MSREKHSIWYGVQNNGHKHANQTWKKNGWIPKKQNSNKEAENIRNYQTKVKAESKINPRGSTSEWMK